MFAQKLFNRGLVFSQKVSISGVVILSLCFSSNLALGASNNDCDRECLKGFADSYFEALSVRDPSTLPLAQNARFTENGSVLELGEGHWLAAGQETFRMQIFDPEQGGIGIVAVIPSILGPAVLGLRLKVENHLITELESVVTYDTEENPIFDAENLSGTNPSYFWTRPLRVPERNSRYEIVSAVEGYWRAFETGGGDPNYIRAPLLPDTIRRENGLQTTNSSIPVSKVPADLLADLGVVDLPPDTLIPTGTAQQQFDDGTFGGTVIADRRYPVVDLEVGAALSMVRFDDTPDGAVVAEFFAVTQGKIREIHAVFTAPIVPGRSAW